MGGPARTNDMFSAGGRHLVFRRDAGRRTEGHRAQDGGMEGEVMGIEGGGTEDEGTRNTT